MYRQSEKKLVTQQYLLYMSMEYGELRPTSGSDRFVSLGHPSKFQRVSRLGSVTAQPNCGVEQRRHLYSTGRPSRWALAHISSLISFARSRQQYISRPSTVTSILILTLRLHLGLYDTIQPVVKPVEQPVEQPAASCKQTYSTGCSTGLTTGCIV